MAFRMNLEQMDSIREEINEASCHYEDRLIGPFVVHLPRGELGDRVFDTIEFNTRCELEEDCDDTIACVVERAQQNLAFEKIIRGAQSVIVISNDDGEVRARFKSDKNW